MFVFQKRGGYRRDGQQWASGYFLVAGLPRTRPPEWLAKRNALRGQYEEECAQAQEPAWKWKYRLPGDLKEYGEVIYHPPFTLIRCFVRFVRMGQTGHFMMGQSKNPALTLSGTYGSDGLPMTLERDIWSRSLPLPKELCDTWATGGGHNTSGAEGPGIHQWANENLKALKKAGKLGGEVIL